MPTINWLNLTDLHFGLENQEWLWPNLRQEFYDDLTKINEAAGPFDAVIFTGDLTQSGSNEEFSKLNDLLYKLWEHFRGLGSDPVLICVPGNHDLNRPESREPIVKALKLWNSDKEIRDEFWSNQKSDYMSAIERYFSNFTNWYDASPFKKPQQYKKGYVPGDFSAIIEKNNYKIGFVGINTAFLQLSADSYDGKLDIHEKQLHYTCDKDFINWSDDLDLSFMLSHHPPSWLSQRAQKIYNSEIAPPGRFFAHMCGHMHEPKTLTYGEFGSPLRRLWQGPSMFGLKTYGSGQDERIHGYSTCKVEFDVDRIAVTVMPRIMHEKYAGNRKLGPDTGYDLNENNSIIFEVKNSKRVALDNVTIYETVNVGKDCVNINKAIDVKNEEFVFDCDKNVIAKLPQLKLFHEPQHLAIRGEDRKVFYSDLMKNRVIWLVSDWGHGKNGFISSAFIEQCPENLPKVFQLKCEDIGNIDDFFNVFKEQFGVSFQEFANVILEIQFPILLLDRIPLETLKANNQIDIFKELISTLLDYNENILLVLDSRKDPGVSSVGVVKLKQLDIIETKTYIASHPESTESLITTEKIEHLYIWSDGLPMYIDYLIKSLKVSQFKNLVSIDIETKFDELRLAEPVPKALIHAVSILSQSESRYSRRSFRLLKILSVLSDGEMLDNIKRFDNADPFYNQNALELEELGLLDIIQMFSAEPEIEKKVTNQEQDFPKLLKVPKQVRDYIKTIIGEIEYSSIINRAADLLFGEQWRSGSLTLSLLAKRRMINQSHSGLGNEYTVVRHLLWESVQKSDHQSIKKVVSLAAEYLAKLNNCGRFKDAYYAAEELVNLIESDDLSKYKTQILLIFAESARMTGRHAESIDVLRHLLDDSNLELSKQQKSSAYLDLALAYKSSSNNRELIVAANTVMKLEQKGSAMYDQAHSLLIEHSDNDKPLIIVELGKLEKKSRRLDRKTNANNMSLTLARLSTSLDRKITYYDSVIDSSGDDYNRIRATIDKAGALISANRTGELRRKDKIMLEFAFSYSYSQKMSNLFNKCSSVVYDLLIATSRYDQILKLFRYSSFLWRIRGEQNLEQKFIEKLKLIDRVNLESAHEIDLKYFKARLNS